MNPVKKSVYRKRRGDALILSMIFVLIFSALAVSMAALSGTNVQLSDNQHNINSALSDAQCGECGDDALNYVHIGVPPSEFPTPCTANFECYIENTLDPETDTTTNLTLENIRIPAGTNPHFSGNVIVRGIVFVESPNIVQFSGNTTITGIIVADGDLDSPSPENQLIFTGSMESYSVSELPDEGFSDLKQETGTFVLAPGFSASFGGDFNTLNGTIAASGISFYGNAGGTINGSVINYAETPMTLSGNTDLFFNRSGTEQNPAGFEPNKILEFLPSSYSEIPL